MDALLITFGIILILIGVVGAVIPGLPGPPLSYLALILLHFTKGHEFSSDFLLITGIIMAAVTILDYVVPVYGTKKFGGSKRGVTGSVIGLIVGIIILPLTGIVLGPFGLFGIILGPFLGAYLGEISGGKSSDTAMKAAFGSFIGFLAGTFMKLVYSVVIGVYFFINLF